MQLYVAEYRKVFTESRRITLFYSREDIVESIAKQLAKPNEMLWEVQPANQAMGLPTTYTDISYTDKKKRRSFRYNKFTKKK